MHMCAKHKTHYKRSSDGENLTVVFLALTERLPTVWLHSPFLPNDHCPLQAPSLPSVLLLPVWKMSLACVCPLVSSLLGRLQPFVLTFQNPATEPKWNVSVSPISDRSASSTLQVLNLCSVRPGSAPQARRSTWRWVTQFFHKGQTPRRRTPSLLWGRT